MQHTTALNRTKRQEEALCSLERSSLSVPHPLSIHVGFAVTHAAFFAPMPDQSRGDDPLFSLPFPQHWGFQALPIANCGLIGFSKSFYQGYCAFAEKAANPLHPHLTYSMGSLRYDAPSNNTARRLLQPDDCRDIAPEKLWAIPLYESAGKAFLAFRTNDRGQGEIFLRTPPSAMPGVLCVYRAFLPASGMCDVFFYDIPAHMDTDRPVGFAPACDHAYLGAVLLQQTCGGGASVVRQVAFECRTVSNGFETKTLFGRVGNNAYHGRQAHPPVSVPSAHAPATLSPKDQYALLCKQFATSDTLPPTTPLYEFVREIDSAVCLAEHSADRLSAEEVDTLQERMELAEERLLPRLMESQTLLREKLTEAAAPKQTPLGCVLTLLVNETRQAWNVLQDIRFRRIPAIKALSSPRLVVGSGTPCGFSRIQGAGDISPLPGGGHCVSDPIANKLLFIKNGIVQREVNNLCPSLGRMRPDGDEVLLLDPEARSLLRFAANGKLLKATGLDLSALPAGDTLEPKDFLLVNGQILLACTTHEKDATTVVLISQDGTAPQVLFALDHRIFPFEVWEVWRNRLLFASSKAATLNMYSLKDGSWEQRFLPLCNSNIRGFALCDDLLFLNYPPNIFAYDLAADRLAHSVYAPDVVGKLPIHTRVFRVERSGEDFRLFISTDAGHLVTHTLTLDSGLDSRCPPLGRETAQKNENTTQGAISC